MDYLNILVIGDTNINKKDTILNNVKNTQLLYNQPNILNVYYNKFNNTQSMITNILFEYNDNKYNLNNIFILKEKFTNILILINLNKINSYKEVVFWLNFLKDNKINESIKITIIGILLSKKKIQSTININKQNILNIIIDNKLINFIEYNKSIHNNEYILSSIID